jgi:hypothetical protein
MQMHDYVIEAPQGRSDVSRLIAPLEPQAPFNEAFCKFTTDHGPANLNEDFPNVPHDLIGVCEGYGARRMRHLVSNIAMNHLLWDGKLRLARTNALCDRESRTAFAGILFGQLIQNLQETL